MKAISRSANSDGSKMDIRHSTALFIICLFAIGAAVQAIF